jgi:hypothetical protein
MQDQAIRKAARVALLACVAVFASACGSPRVIQAITGARDQMKFVYREGGAQGVLKCAVLPNGQLTQCRQMKIVLEE